MKTILKLIGGLIIGIIAGLAIAAVISVLFTDTTLSEFTDNLLSTTGVEVIKASIVGMAAFIISIVVLIPIHELGHLVCGLLTGYKFVSFRIFNFAFIRIDGKIRMKKFAVYGTGGQCLLTPPDLPLEQIPTVWYNAGGVLANAMVLLLVIPLFFINLHPFALEALAIFCLTDFILILINGIPLKLDGISNDGYNIIYLNRNLLSKRAIVLQLCSNALVQNGIRPKEMPDEWFVWRTDIDYRNPLEVSIPLMHASRLVDQMMFEDAYNEFAELYSHKADIMQLYVNEIACELAFCALATGQNATATELLDPELKKYIDAYKNVMSSKQRILCAIALYLDNEKSTAEKIFRKLDADREKYLLQGEVKSDLAIMEWMINRYQA